MSKNKIAIVLGVMTILALAISGCYKTTTIVKNPGADITTVMSFSKDINPIFTNSCALAGCHVPGAKTPDLSAANAYASLKNGNYIKAKDPDNSELILWLTGKKSPVMPLGKGPDQAINAKIYAWINQGAQNN
jgi:hypothetical protein